MSYVVMTDSDSDLPYSLKVEYDIPVVNMPYALNGKEYFDDLGQTIDPNTYYDHMRQGASPVTSALNEADYLEYFDPILKESDLLFIAFSSKLSSTIVAARSAREKLLKKYPERKFFLIDTLSISTAQALLVLKAKKMADAGAPIEEVADWVEKNKLRAQAFFTVEDLKYLKRGGRVSPAAAAFGTMLDIKPVLCESKEGTLIPVEKVRGRKKAISALVDHLTDCLPDPAESPAIIIHADIPDDAERLKELILQKVPELDIIISTIGPVIGAHTGPGTLGITWIGTKERVL